MPMTPQQIMNEARQLPGEQMSELFDLMLAEAFAQSDPAIEGAWRVEVRRRLEAVESGNVQGVPGEQVMAELRRIAGM